ncbi:YoaK family protein [Streptomyces flavofungini]|uniref:YoaK family protein n=1 Tax=Streptomyces flavofungini TaxID=68200 RepID=UPI0025B272FD|nr:YoaK family protein [Streptomyces flavofungini]WJV50574.1 YoaK family protein [Streptomyces flavofungini]
MTNDQQGAGVETPGPQVGDRHPLALVLFALTAVSGFVDAVTFLGLGRVFAANMTGNVVVIGFAAAGAPGFSVVGSLVSLGAFLVGAAGAGRLARALRGRRRATWVRAALAGEAVLLGVTTALAFAGAADATYALIALLALAMGLRNGTVLKLNVPDLTTTVLTRTLTGLAAESRLAGGTDRLAVRRVGATLAMIAGALPGAWLVLRHGIGWPLLVGTAAVTVVACVYRERPGVTPEGTGGPPRKHDFRTDS